MLGSYSTDFKAQIGGYEGRLLKKGDVLATQYRDKYLLPCGFEPINFTTNIGTLPSSESEFFTEESLSLFGLLSGVCWRIVAVWDIVLKVKSYH